MHRLGRQKKLYLSYLRTAIIAVLFLVVAIPFVNKVANGGKTYTPEDRYMVVLNGQELGCVSDITIAQEALKDARNQVNASNKGVALVESDIKIFKETAGGAVVSKEALSESIYSTLMSAAVDSDSFKSAYTVRIDDFTVTLGSKDEVIQLFERVKDNLIGCKKNYTLRFKEGFKLTVKLNPKLKVIGEVPEGVDVYKQTVDESKLKKYEGEHWVMSYENKPTITVVKETM